MDDPFDLGSDEPPSLAAPPAYLDGLNPAQRQAVEATDGPVLVLAGAGTGKTRVLTTRLAHILDSGLAYPGEILAVTFTNKAAREMRERIGRLLGRSVEGMWLGTFHAIATRILRRHAELAGLKSNFTIIDTDDQIRLLKQVMAAHQVDEKKWPARVLIGIIQRWKDRALTPDKVAEAEGADFAHGRAVALYREYQQRLETLNAADFGDLLLHCLTLFTNHADVLADYQRRFRYILVDEYQDTNVAQYLWLRLLARQHRNICCVGDDDQSIYAWRGAEVGNILRFEEDFPGARVVRLERNYRSTGHILGAASGLIAHNRGRLGKTLWTEDDGGEKVVVRGVWDGEEEARIVADEIEALQRREHPLSQMAVLVRASFQTRAFEERFITIGLPYRVIGGLRFYERLEIRDAIAYLRVIAQPDDDLAFERIVNRPKRGIGDSSLQILNRAARAAGLSMTATAEELLTTDELRGRARTGLETLITHFARWRTMAATVTPAELARTVLDESGYTAMWQADKSVEAPGRLENLKELVNALEEFESLEGFLDHVGLVMDNNDAADGDMVNIMTLHGAKGLEFDTVFLPGWEEQLFPHQRALDESGQKGLEEERRLAYVGITRARRKAFVLHAASRQVYNQWNSQAPSRFLDELPGEHVERRSDLMGSGMRDQPMNFDFDASRPSFGRRASNYGRYVDARRQQTTLDMEPVSVTYAEHEEGTFAVGGRVFHQKFGYGRIRAVDGNKLDIAFEKAGNKKVMDSFVQPA
ncbi:MAG: DNA helicase II [Rhodospirillaceae bacterium]|nr:DNA helicase II [Rhodospirillaceae bacterium]